MSASNRLLLTAAAIGLVALILLNSVVAVGLIGRGIYEANHSCRAYSGAERHSENSNLGANIIRSPNCVTQAPPREADPTRAQWRAELDLKAQRDMAFWALMMFGTSFGGLMLTGIGVVLVAQQLALTRDLAAEERRPWIKVTAEVVDAWPPDHVTPLIDREDAVVVVAFTMENIGKSLAYSLMFSGPLVSEEGESGWDFQAKLRTQIQKMRGRPLTLNRIGTSLFPGQPKTQRFIVSLGNLMPRPDIRRFPYFGGFASYRLTPNGPFHFTPIMLEFGWNGPPDAEKMPLAAAGVRDEMFTDLAPD